MHISSYCLVAYDGHPLIAQDKYAAVINAVAAISSTGLHLASMPQRRRPPMPCENIPCRTFSTSQRHRLLQSGDGIGINQQIG
jgi:hypothetical protein